jgi:hypothetical protein
VENTTEIDGGGIAMTAIGKIVRDVAVKAAGVAFAVSCVIVAVTCLLSGWVFSKMP